MFNRLLFLLLAGVSCAAVAAPKYDFARYSSGKIYQGKRAAVKMPKQLKNFLGNDRFKTIYKEVKQGKIDFASYYVTASWGCGTGCLSGALVDVRDGKMYELTPYGTDYPLWGCYIAPNKEDTEIFHHRANSRLFVTENCHYSNITGREDVITQHRTTYVYEWLEKRKKFVLRKRRVRKSIVPSSVHP